MKFYKFWKTWRNGGYCETYHYTTEDWQNDPDQLKYDCEQWAETIGGGFGHGYEYHLDEVKAIPQEWLSECIKRKEATLEALEKQVELLESFLSDLKKKK